MKKKKIIIILIIFFIILCCFISFLAVTKHKQILKDIETKERKEAQEKMLEFETKEIVIIKGQKLSTDVKDYIKDIKKVTIDINKLKLDTSQVNTKKVGSYGYKVTYYDAKKVNTIHVAKDKKDKEKIEKEIKEQEKELEEAIKKNKEIVKKEEQDASKKTNTTSEADVVIPEVSKTNSKQPDYNVTQYSYNYHPDMPSAPIKMENYNGELWYVFEKPIAYDIISATASQKFQNENQDMTTIYKRALTIAKNTFTESKPYCVENTDYFYAMNKDKDLVGVAARAVIGTLSEEGTCTNDNKIIYLNDRKKLYLDDESMSFKSR